jgi:hypothetical protein
VSGHALRASVVCCFPPEITSKESPQFFFYSKDGWLIDGFGTEKYGSNVIARVQFKIVLHCKIPPHKCIKFLVHIVFGSVAQKLIELQFYLEY